jgi:hypothetical protein
VDAIFRAGHWNDALAHKLVESIAGGLVPSQSALTPEQTSRARSLRKVALQERLRSRKWSCGNAPAGKCQGQDCGWRTDWDHDPYMKLRTECWACGKLVRKRWCALEDHARPLVTISSSKKQQQKQEQRRERKQRWPRTAPLHIIFDARCVESSISTHYFVHELRSFA